MLSATGSAHAAAELEKAGAEQFPGKLALGIHALGFQAPFDDRAPGGYELHVDLAGRAKKLGKAGSLWVGGGLSYAHPSYTCATPNGCAHDVAVELFVRVTLERLLNIPLVPFLEAGLGGDVLGYSSYSNVGGGVPIRVGAGFHYYVLKQLGLGLETNFAFGPGFYPAATQFCGAGRATCVGLFGHWDVLAGARIHF
jgi:hypothetical protein